MTDLFKNYEEQPVELKAICDKWLENEQSDGLSYQDCKMFLKEVESIGFTFEYGLDAEPFNLKPIDDFKTIGLLKEYFNLSKEHYKIGAMQLMKDQPYTEKVARLNTIHYRLREIENEIE